MPWVDGTTSVAVVHNDVVLDEVQVSANAPVVNFTSPASPETWTDGSTETLTWEGSDADGDDLSYSILYTGGGDVWELIETGITGTSYDVEVDFFAGSDVAQFGVVATDGLNVGKDETPLLRIPNKAPMVVISNPAPGTIVTPGGLLVLSGSAVDLEDGSIPDESYEWTSDVDGFLGAGPSYPLSGLSNGLHMITLTVEDSDGLASSESVEILVAVPASIDFLPDAVPPGGDPPDVKVVVVLPWGHPTDTIDVDSLKLVVGNASLSPTSATVLGDTDSDGLIELELTFDGEDVQNALPGGLDPATVTLTGELEDGTQIQGVDTVIQVAPGDADCDGDADAVDALQVLRKTAGLPTDAACLFAADIDCDGDQDAVDALNILRNNAGLPIEQPTGCPQIGVATASSGGFGLLALPSFLWLSVLFVVPAFVVTRRRLVR